MPINRQSILGYENVLSSIAKKKLVNQVNMALMSSKLQSNPQSLFKVYVNKGEFGNKINISH